MNEEKKLKESLLKHMKYNLIAFAIILSLFAGLMFGILKTITYRSVDAELYSAKEELLEFYNYRNLENSSNIPDWFKKEFFGFDITNILEERVLEDLKSINKRISNPRINLILWDSNEKIVIEFGRISEYDSELSVNLKNLDTIYEKQVANDYHYRGINFKLDYNGDSQDEIVQLLINIDTEKYLVKSYFEIIASAVIVGIIASVIISYILSKKTLKPIAENILRQTEFIQNASHELRTPLTIIQAKQELLLEEPDAKIIDKIEDISITLEETKRLTKLTKDLLLLTRNIDTSKDIKKETTNIDEFLGEILKNYIELAEVENKKLTLNLNSKKEIKIDRTKIHQLMVILIDNAIKYTEEDDIIEVITHVKDNKLQIEVKDTGIGVSDEGLTRIFERFYRDDKARNRETGGNGLGLSIASQIIKQHNGTIVANHNEPKGTNFIVRLPLK